jgi:hypothetical protein
MRRITSLVRRRFVAKRAARVALETLTSLGRRPGRGGERGPGPLVRKVRCVWSFRDRSPGKDWRFPFTLPKDGAENPERIVAAAGGTLSSCFSVIRSVRPFCLKERLASSSCRLSVGGRGGGAEVAIC